MSKITLGSQEYTLSAARADASLKTILDTYPNFAATKSLVVYFWDCATQTGLPKRRARNIRGLPEGIFLVFNKQNGKQWAQASRANIRFHAQKIALTGPKFTEALRTAFPPLAVGVPYATHVDPFMAKYRLMLVVNVHMITLKGERIGAGVDEPNIWITVPTKITFKTTLLNRCDGKPVVAPEGWDPEVTIPVELNQLVRGLKEQHDEAIAPPPNEH